MVSKSVTRVGAAAVLVGLSVAGPYVATVSAESPEADSSATSAGAPADQQRTRRALEVVRSTGVALSVWQQQREGGLEMPVRALVLRGNRAALYARCDARFVAMVAAGAVDDSRVSREIAAGHFVIGARARRPRWHDRHGPVGAEQDDDLGAVAGGGVDG
jgi:hypothetical protein